MHTALHPSQTSPVSPASAMLDAAEPLEGAHALVLGAASLASLDVLCGLIGRGCGAACELPLEGPVPAEPAEIVLVPQVDSIDAAMRAILMTRRCLLPCGRIVMHDASGRLAGQFAQLLRAAGFSFVRVKADVISADWPMFGHQIHGAGRA